MKIGWNNYDKFQSKRHSNAKKYGRAGGRYASMKPKKRFSVNLDKYQGVWYQQAGYPQWFQQGCKLSKAEYKKIDDETISVKNTCYKVGGGKSDIEGDAVVERKNLLGVSFFPLLPASPYKIEWVDEKYELAIVGSPDKENLWFLSRNKNIPKSQIEKMKGIAQKKGYSLSKLEYKKVQR